MTIETGVSYATMEVPEAQLAKLDRLRFSSAAQMLEAVIALLDGEPGYMKHAETLRGVLADLELDR